MFRKSFALMLFVFLLAGTASAVEFSADAIMTSKQGKMMSKMFYKQDKFRMEMKGTEDVIMITRMDRKVIWNIMPKEKMYMELPFDLNTKDRPMVEDKFEGEIERKHVGNEMIDSHPTKKYLITYKSGNTKSQVYQWWATDINFPVKTAAIDGSWTQEFKNIKMGSQPNSLFEVPAGYRKFQMPSGMNFK